MEIEHFSFNIQKVHKLNLKITFFMVALIVIPLIIKNGLGDSKLYIIAGLSVIACGLLNYFIKIPYRIKAVLFAALPGTVIFALYLLDGFALNKHYFMFITVVMAAIYFDRKILLIYGALIEVYVVSLYVIAPENF